MMKRSYFLLLALTSCLLSLNSYASEISKRVGAKSTFASLIETGHPDYEVPNYSMSFAGETEYITVGDSGTTDEVYPELVPNKLYAMTIGGNELDQVSFTLYPPDGYLIFVDGVERTYLSDSDWQGDWDEFNDNYAEHSWTIVLKRKERISNSNAPAGTDLGLKVGPLEWGVSMGNLANGKPAGNITLAAESISSTLFEPSALNYYTAYTTSDDVDVIRTGTGGSILRQVYTPQALADIVDLGSSYEIRFYKPADVGSKTATYAVSGTPFIKYKIEKLGGSNSQLKLTRTEGTRTTITEATYNSGDWTLEADNADLRKLTKTSSTATGDRVETTVVKHKPDTTELEATRFIKTYDDDGFAWGEELIELKETIDSNDYITTYDYYTNSSDKGDYTRLKSITYPDGNWVRYDYDDGSNYRGLVTKEYRPFKDSPTAASSATDTNCLATTYSYTTVWTGGTPLPSTIETKNNNVTVAKSTFSYSYGSQHNSKYALVTTRNDYSDSTNYQTTVTAAYRSDQVAFYANKPIYVRYPDGRMQYYELTYDGVNDEWTESIYEGTSNATGAVLKTTVLSQNFYLIKGKSTRIDIIRDNRGFVTDMESYVYNYDATATFEKVTGITYEYEDAGYLKKRTGSNNTVYEATWVDGEMISEETPDGTITDYTYDDLDRVTKKVVKTATVEGVVLPDITTQYEYDSDSRLLKQTVGPVSDPNPLVTEWVYHTAGRLEEMTAPGGYKTTYAYSSDDRTVTKTLPGISGDGGAGTEITTTYRDGSVKSITGTAVSGITSTAGQYFDYGTETDGRRWRKIAMGTSIASTRWQKQWVNWRRQITKEEAPSYNTLGNFIRSYVYDTTTGLLSYRTEPGLANTYYTYNTFGEVEYEWLDVASGGTKVDNSADRIKKHQWDYEKNTSWRRRYQEYVADMDASGNPTGTESRVQMVLQQLNLLSSNETHRTYTYDINDNVTMMQVYQYPTTHKRVEQVRPPDGSGFTVNTYGNGLLVKSVSREGVTATYSYDNYGRNHKVNDRTGDHTTVFVNGTVLPSQIKGLGAAQEITHEYAYYSTGKVKQVKRHEDATGSSYLNTYLAYDTTGRLTKRWGDEGYPVLYEYDSTYGHLKKQNTYRGGSGWTGSTWPGSPGTADITEWVVETKTGLITSKKDAANESVLFEYNQRGQLSKRTWARGGGQHTTYSYDSHTAELTGVNYSDTTPDITYAYSRLGTLKSVTDATGTRTFSFRTTPRKDWLVEKETLDSSFYGSGRQLSYAFLDTRDWGPPFLHNRGKLEYTRYGTSGDPDAYVETKYAYDGTDGRISSIKDDIGAKTFTYGYETNSNLVKTITSGSYTATRTWSSLRDRVDSIETKWSTNSKVKHAYTYDWLDRRTENTQTGEIFEAYGTSNGLETDYTYNDRSELLTASTVLGGTSTQLPDRKVTFTYDNAGNRATSKEGDSTAADSYTTNSLNQYDARTVSADRYVRGFANSSANVLIEGNPATRHGDYFYDSTNQSSPYTIDVKASMPGAGAGGSDLYDEITEQKVIPSSFTYDLDGNLTSDGNWTYAYDLENQLISMTKGTTHLTFKYDYLGRRVEKVVYSAWNGSSGTVDSHLRFVYDGWNLMAEQDQSGTIERTYTWGLDESHTLQGAGGVGGLLMITDGSDRYNTAYDANGNLSALLDNSDGSVEAAYEYGPSGELLRITGDYANDNPFRVSTKYYDKETELIYYGLRYYSASMGRFINRDPIGEAGGLNLYAFVGNNTINSWDYLGMVGFSIHLQIGGRYGILGRPIDLLWDTDGMWQIDINPVTGQWMDGSEMYLSWRVYDQTYNTTAVPSLPVTEPPVVEPPVIESPTASRFSEATKQSIQTDSNGRPLNDDLQRIYSPGSFTFGEANPAVARWTPSDVAEILAQSPRGEEVLDALQNDAVLVIVVDGWTQKEVIYDSTTGKRVAPDRQIKGSVYVILGTPDGNVLYIHSNISPAEAAMVIRDEFGHTQLPELSPSDPKYGGDHANYRADHLRQEVWNEYQTQVFAWMHNQLNPKGPKLPLNKKYLNKDGYPDINKIYEDKSKSPFYNPKANRKGVVRGRTKDQPINPRSINPGDWPRR